MKTKRFLLIAITPLLLLSITACVLSKSTPQALPTIDLTAENPFPEPVTDTTLELLSSITTPTPLGSDTLPIDLTASVLDLTPLVLETQGTSDGTPGGTPGVATLQPLTMGTPLESTPLVINMPTYTPGPRPTTYTLQQGEFPYCIARRFNINIGTLLTLNGLSSASKPLAGVSLQIPQDGVVFGAARALHTHPGTYTLKTNDKIYSVACYYGDVEPLVIAQVNNLQSPYTLTAGQTLNIP